MEDEKLIDEIIDHLISCADVIDIEYVDTLVNYLEYVTLNSEFKKIMEDLTGEKFE